MTCCVSRSYIRINPLIQIKYISALGATMKTPPHRKTRKADNTPGEAHELTFTCFKYRKFLCKDRTRQFFIDSLDRARHLHNFHLWAFAIMPEHVHAVIFPAEEKYDISAILTSVKLSVSKKALNYLRRNNPAGMRQLATGVPELPYAFWMEGGGYDRNVIKLETLAHMINYVHNNAVRRGLVEEPGEWFWSSAREWEVPG